MNKELLAAIDKAFKEGIRKNAKIKALYKRIRDGTATYVHANQFAQEIGKELSKALGKNITIDILPDGKLRWTIGKEVIEPELIKGYEYVSAFAEDVQAIMYNADGLGLKPVKPELDQSRIDGILNKLDSAPYDNVSWLLTDPSHLQNFFESIVDDSVEKNAELVTAAGGKAKIIRTCDGSHPCSWCASLAGEYDYPCDKEIYRRHANCHCTVIYEEVSGFRQNAHTKKVLSQEEVDKRKKYAEQATPIVLTKEEAASLTRKLLHR